ncbi:hypothetical protein FJQ98_16145 [Lysinibacillus agricola]|uniref:Uncharacterized protein n=1 Tax=Lysinibacillus agricola TaxID=2590012 RepID=A0ABX7AMQ8_9BACI|nr:MULTISPECIES: hypothetical protein [Lysinibacillus]KOS61526.1 hypothetical protein AN161_18225 [Lysinibacillus sp. FJAT-14222]QQP10777.1 hypothetical protein FJQ98_16145 [Lysinibacillus agricola]
MKKRVIIANIIRKLESDSRRSPNPFASTLSEDDYIQLGKSYYADELLREIRIMLDSNFS